MGHTGISRAGQAGLRAAAVTLLDVGGWTDLLMADLHMRKVDVYNINLHTQHFLPNTGCYYVPSACIQFMVTL